jgi:CheY-like chemotaxis protein
MESTLRMAWNEIRHRARLVKNYGRVPRVDANEARLGQVFLNLVVNAAQAIKEGHAHENVIRVTTACDGADHVLVEIADTGAGIAPDVQKHLFTPFFTTKPAGVGTGLGLTICHRIVESFSGEIGFESSAGKGTVFRIRLPAAEDEQKPSARTGAAVPTAPRRGRVLIVDDERPISRVLERLLRGEHDVTAVDSGACALELFEKGEWFDVVLCDLMLPNMTGMQLYEATKDSSPLQADRFVFMTGGAFTPWARNFLATIANHRVEKPFDAQGLRAIVNGLVR